ncbi:hypothetical protein ACN4EK_05730 [Pantanalinema rosaneae CENA516]|uniref:hypothetical protein n=1 Tax=Pantanalinema rosaneae TaxID=1620701 RepID=UPI003D6DACC3
MFAPILKQTIPHPQHTWLLPTALTLAALGISQHQLTKFKSRLQPGVHWIEEIGSDRVRRHFYTHAGVLELCNLVCSDRADQLHQAIVSQSSHAIIPRPATTAIHESQWQPRQPEPPQYQEPGQLIGYHSAALDIQPPPVSSKLLHDPRLFELLQLKRDELEVQRSQLENERLRMIQTAYQQQQSAIPTQQIQYQPPPELDPKAVQPINIKVKVENKSEGGYYWNAFGFVELVFMVCMVSLFAIGAFAAVASLRPHHSSLPEMNRYV